MSTGYADTGRVRQKRRTRDALVSAARSLIAEGTTPTVEEAAAAADVSRTTAYRYFSTQRELLIAAHPEIDLASLLPPDAPADDVEERFAAVIDAIIGIVTDTESQQRTMLRLSLEATPEQRANLILRRGRAIAWIEDALAPLREQMPAQAQTRLVLATRSAVGIEALVWLKDVAGLSTEDAVATMRWSAHALLQASLTAQP